MVRRGSDAKPDPLVLTIRVDGRMVWQDRIPFRPDSVVLDLQLAGARQLELAVDRTGPIAKGAWIHIAGARAECTPRARIPASPMQHA